MNKKDAWKKARIANSKLVLAAAFIILFLSLFPYAGSQQNPQVFTDKQVYELGETVNLVIISGEPVQIEIKSGSGNYKFFGNQEGAAQFLPSQTGEYSVSIKGSVQESKFTVVLPQGQEEEPVSQNPSIQQENNQDYSDSTSETTAESINDVKLNENLNEKYSETIKNPELQDRKEPRIIIRARQKDATEIKFFERRNIRPNLGIASVSNIYTTSETNTVAVNQKYDAQISREGKNELLEIQQLIYTDGLSIGLEDIPADSTSVEKGSILAAYAIDMGSANFDSATYTRTAKGEELWKCAEWEFETQTCNGEWIKVQDIIPGQEYTIPIYAGDPGFAEVTLAIINVHSYPASGGNWTVKFETNGTADLIIRPADGTTWTTSLFDLSSDLLFLDLTCGGEPVAYAWENNTLIAHDYSCSERGTETSQVITDGIHVLEFSFGNTTARAYNRVWWNTTYLYRSILNITNTDSSRTLKEDYSINLTINTTQLIQAGKLNSDCSDLRITWFNGTKEVELDRVNETSCNSSTTEFWFRLQENVTAAGWDDSNYTVYYGNILATSPPENKSNIYYLWEDFEDQAHPFSNGALAPTVSTGSKKNGNYGLEGNGAGGYRRAVVPENLTGGMIIEGWVNSHGAGGNADLPGLEWGMQHSSELNGYQAIVDWRSASGGSADMQIRENYNSGSPLATSTANTVSTYTWYYLRAKWNDTGGMYVQVWNESRTLWGTMTATDTTYTTGYYGVGAYKNGYWDDIKARLFLDNQPQVSTLAEETVQDLLVLLNFPEYAYQTTDGNIDFNCSATSGSSLINITLYGNWSGNWEANETANITGLNNGTVFSKSLPEGEYIWNCLAEDDAPDVGYYAINYTLSIDQTPPSISIHAPSGIVKDTTPSFNVSFGENVDTAWYAVNSSSQNVTLCTSCSSASTYMNVEEGNFSVTVWANDSLGNYDFDISTFSIQMNQSYYDTFADNSSIQELSGTQYATGSVSFTGLGGETILDEDFDDNNATDGSPETWIFVNEGVADNSPNWVLASGILSESGNCHEDSSATGRNTTAKGCFAYPGNRTWTDMNITARIRASDDDGIGIMFRYQDPDNYYRVRFEGTQNFRKLDKFSGGVWTELDADSLAFGGLTQDQWSNVTITVTGQDINVYLDGVSVLNATDSSIQNGSVALYSWGMESLTPGLGADFDMMRVTSLVNGYSSANMSSKMINTTNMIQTISNITWTESGTNSSNNITIFVSADGGNNWCEASDGAPISGENCVIWVKGNSLQYRVFFESNEQITTSLEDINISWIEDTNKPNITINLPLPDEFITDNILVNVTAVDYDMGVQSVISAIIDSAGTNVTGWSNLSIEYGTIYEGDWTGILNISGLSDGYYNVTVNATDGADLYNDTERTQIIIDGNSPELQIINPQNASVSKSTMLVNVSINDTTTGTESAYYILTNSSGQNTTSWVVLSLNSGSANAGYWEAYFDTTTISDGAYNVTANATDYAGNENISMSIQIYLDNTPPTVGSKGINGSIIEVNKTICINASGVTDNLGIDEVWAVITYPNGSSANVSLSDTGSCAGGIGDGYYSADINTGDTNGYFYYNATHASDFAGSSNSNTTPTSAYIRIGEGSAEFIDSEQAVNAAASTSVTVPVPPLAEDGDLLIAVLTTASSSTGVPSPTQAGWIDTGISQGVGGAAPSAPLTRVFYREANSEPASYQFNFTASVINSGAILVYRNVSIQPSPIDDSGTNSGDSANPVGASIDTSKDNEIVVWIAFSDTGGTAITNEGTGTSLREQIAAGSGAGGAQIMIADELWSDSSTDTGTRIFTRATEQWGTITLGLRSGSNSPPTAPTKITCDNQENCNITLDASVEINASGALDVDGDNITYFIEAAAQHTTEFSNTTAVSKGVSVNGWELVGTPVTGTTTVTTGSTVVNLPSGLQQGDLIIIGLACDNALNADGITGQGYTDIEAPTSNALPGRQLTYKIVGATPDSTVSILNNAARTAYVIQAWRGADTTTPLDVTSTSATSVANGDPDSPSITPVSKGALVFSVGLGDDDDGTITTAPTGYSNASYSNTGQGSTTVGATVVMASKVWSSGAENPSAWNLAAFSDGWVAWTVALRPKRTSNETNTSETAYTQIGDDFLSVSSLDFKVEVDSYNPNGSVNRSTSYPDLWLELYNGSSWVSGGSFNLTAIYTGSALNTTNANVSITITDPVILNSWESSTNQSFRIKGVYMDHNGSYYDSAHDEINYTGVWANINGFGWISLGNHTQTTTLSWDVTNVDEQLCIDLRARAADLKLGSEYSAYYTKDSCLSVLRNPEITNAAINATEINQSESVILNVTISDESSLIAKYVTIKYPNGSTENLTLTNYAEYEYFVEFNNTNSSGLYNITNIVAEDALNNINNTVPYLTFIVTTSPPSDFNLVSPENATVSSNLQPNMTWEQTEDNEFDNYTLYFDKDPAFSSPDFTYSTFDISATNRTPDSSLDNDSVYYWRVVAYDVFGNSKQSSQDFIYTTDNTEPYVEALSPENGSVFGYSTINLQYNVSDSSTIDNCSVFINGSLNDTNSTVTKLIAQEFILNFSDGIYTWEISCSDSAGNHNTTQNTTLFVDTIPPVLGSKEINVSTSDLNTTICINASGVTDNLGIDEVWAVITYPNGSSANVSLSDTGSCAGGIGDGYYSADINTGETNGYFYYNETHANDTAGNSAYNLTTISIFLGNEIDPPIIELLGPMNNSGDVDGLVLFSYNASDASNITSCTLYLDNYQNETNSTVNVNTTSSIIVESIPFGAHTWRIECSDEYGNIGVSGNRTFYGIAMTGFAGVTTDISNMDVTNISGFFLDVPLYGSINFTETIDLSSAPNIDLYVVISSNKIAINSSAIPALNKSAIITFKSLENTQLPLLLQDGYLCSEPECEFISYSAGTAIFNVSHFSNYTTSVNSQLNIWDESDPEGGFQVKYVGNDASFWANYTNLSSGAAINDVDTYCQIDYADYSVNMTFNATTELYEYNRSFPTENSFDWTVTCDGSSIGYEPLSLQDSINIFGSAPAIVIAELNESLVEAGNYVLLNATITDDSGNDTVENVTALFEYPNGTQVNVSLIQNVQSGLQSTGTLTLSAQQFQAYSDRRTIGESGSINTTNLTWHLVEFVNTYNETPVVIVTPVTQNEPVTQDDSPIIPLISSINETHMNISLCIDNGTAACTGSINEETLHYFVFDVNETSQFPWISVGTAAATTDGADTVISYGKTFSSVPVLWLSAQTYNQGGNVGAIAWAESITTRGTSSGPILGCTHRGTANACDTSTPAETFGFVAVDVNTVNITGWQDGTASISNSAWTAATFSPVYSDPRAMVTQNADNGAQDPQYSWARNVTSSGMDYRYCEADGADYCDTHTGENVYWFALEDGEIIARGASTANESNISQTIYTNIDNTTTSNVYSVNITLEVVYYSNASSDAFGNNNPDLSLEMATADESGWTYVGSFNISGTGNHSITITNPTIIQAWKAKANRDIRITGVNFDYSNDSAFDEINWSTAYVSFDYDLETSLWEYIWNETSYLGEYLVRTLYATDNNSMSSEVNFTNLNFTVTVTPLEPFNLLSPADLQISADLSPVFVWNNTSARNFVNYTLEVDADSDFSSPDFTNYTTEFDNTTAILASPLAGDATYYWRVLAVNAYGNVTYSSENFTYITDISSPSVVLDYPFDDTYVTMTTFQLNYTPFDMNLQNCSLYGNFTGSFEYNQTNTSPSNGDSNQFTVTLPDGTYIWNVVCYDVLDRASFAPANFTVRVDLTPPQVNAEGPANNTYENETNNIVFYYNVTDIMTGIDNCVLAVDDVQSGNADITVSEGVTQNFTAFVDNGAHYWQINCTDNNGFTGQSLIYNITVNVTSESDPPIIILNYPDIDAHLPLSDITFNYTPQDASGIENCSLYIDGQINSTNYTITNNGENYFPVTGLSEDIHSWYIACYDNNTYAIGNSFQRNVTVDLTDPVVSLDFPGDQDFYSQSDVDFNYTPTDTNLANCSIFINESGSFAFDFADETPVSSVQNNFSKTIIDGTYIWNVICYDYSGRSGFAPANYTAKIDANAPLLENETVYPSSESNYSVSNTHYFNISLVEAFLDTLYLESNFTGTPTNYSVTVHTDEIYTYSRGPLAAGIYNYKWFANDSLGRLSNTSDMTYIVNKSAPNINLTLNGTQGNLTFNESGNVTVVAALIAPSYGNLEVYRDGSLISNGSSPRSNLTVFTIPGVYNITAHYAETQNFTEFSETSYVIVQDITPPVIYLTSPAAGGNVGSSLVTFVYNVSDSSSLNNCSLYINGTIYDTDYAVQTYQPSQFQQTLSDGNYSWQVECYDSSSNYNITATRTFTLLDSTIFKVAVDSDSNYQKGEIANITTNVTDVFGNPLFSSNVTTDIILGNTSVPWWNNSWKKRMLINVTNQFDEPRTETVTVNLTGLTGNITNCLTELRVVKHDDAEYEEVARVITAGDNSTYCTIVFDAQLDGGESSPGKYWAYYNNSGAATSGLTYSRNSLFVQRGTVSGTGLQLSQSIQSVNTSRSLLLFYPNSASSNPDIIQFSSNLDSSNVYFDRYASGTSAWINWELLESEELSVQRGATTFLSAEAEINVTISEVNLSNSFIVVDGRASSSNGAQNNFGFFRASFVNSTTIKLTRSTTGSTATAGWQVVQWDGATVQNGSLTFTGTSSNANITAVNLSRSMLFFSRSINGDTGLDENLIRGNYTNTTRVVFTRTTGTSNAYVDWFAVQLPGWYNVQRGTVVSSIDANVALSAVVTNRSFNRGSFSTTGGGTTYSNALESNNITNTTNLLIDKATTGQTHTVLWQVAEAKSLNATAGEIQQWISTTKGTTDVDGLFEVNEDTLYYSVGNYSAVSVVSTAGYADTKNYSSFEILPDTSAPMITINSPDSGVILGSQMVDFNWSVYDYSRNSTCSLIIDSVVNKTGILVLNNQYANTSVSGFNEGIHYWNISCADVYSNAGTSETRNFTIDTTPPSILLLSPEDGYNASNSTLEFIWNQTDGASENITCAVYLDGNNVTSNATYTSGSNSAENVSGIGEGNHSWNVTCFDTSGNSNTSQTQSFYVLGSPSSVNIIVNANESTTINWSAVSGADSYNIYITDNYSEGFPGTPNITGLTSQNYTDNSANDTYRRFYKVSSVRGSAEALMINSTGKYDSQMYSGFNIISSPFILETYILYNGTNSGYTFNLDEECLVSLWSYSQAEGFLRTDWISGSFSPAFGSENFTSLNSSRGYWLEANETCKLTFAGIVPIQNQSINLNQDFNLVPWFSVQDEKLPTDYEPILIQTTPSYAVQAIDRFNASTQLFEVTIHYLVSGVPWGWFPSFDNQDFTRIQPMEGYYFDSQPASVWEQEP